jgi:membrane protease YdiL (CAAX protease family)
MPEMKDGLLFRIAEKIAPRTSADFAAFAGLSCTAGLCEEFLYRGFVFAVFARMLANTALSMAGAAALSSAWFAIGHLYQGKRGLVTTFVVGMLFSAVRIWSGSLIPSIAAHAGIDLIAGLFVSHSITQREMFDVDESKA